MLVECYAVLRRKSSVERVMPWPHWVGALPTAEEAHGFVPAATPEHPFRRGEFWRAIRLTRETDILELGTVMAEICLYASDATDEPADVLSALADVETVVVGGGIELIVDDELVSTPGCCAGLETWREWIAFVDGGMHAPWCGHDPETAFSRLPTGEIVVARAGRQAVLDRDVLRSALAVVERELGGFASNLQRWLANVAPHLMPRLATKLASDLSLGELR